MQIALIVALVISIGIAVFAIQNSIPVTASFLFWEIETSLVVLILGSALAGAFISALLAAVRSFRLSSQMRELKRRLREIEAGAEPGPPPPSNR